MLYYLKEYGKYAEITGYKNIKFAKAEEFLKANRKETQENVDLQFFDAQLIATQEHLYFAALNALQAFRNKTNISKSLAVETMLYASAQRQIQRAIQRCGIKPQTTNMATTIIGEKPTEIHDQLKDIAACVGAKPDDGVLEMTAIKLEKIKETFQIKPKEINSIVNNSYFE